MVHNFCIFCPSVSFRDLTYISVQPQNMFSFSFPFRSVIIKHFYLPKKTVCSLLRKQTVFGKEEYKVPITLTFGPSEPNYIITENYVSFCIIIDFYFLERAAVDSVHLCPFIINRNAYLFPLHSVDIPHS